MSKRPFDPLRMLRMAVALVVLFGLGMVVWLIDKAVLNPDVRAKQPGWVEGTFNVPFWLPLILTVVAGVAAVVAVYVKAYRRLRRGEDLYGGSYRERVRQRMDERVAEEKERD